jgi:hypothetical protein
MYEMHGQVSQDSSVGRVTSTQTGLQFFAWDQRFLSSLQCPKWLWGSHSLLSSEYQGPRCIEIKQPECVATHSSPPQLDVQEGLIMIFGHAISQAVTGLSPQTSGFIPGTFHVEFGWTDWH